MENCLTDFVRYQEEHEVGIYVDNIHETDSELNNDVNDDFIV